MKSLNEIATEILAKLDEKREKENLTLPRYVNYASDLGFPCLKSLVHARLDWEKKAKVDTEVLYRFEDGKEIEKQIIRMIQEAGYEVELQQQPFMWEKFKISGRIDGMIRVDRELIPFEVKSVEKFTYHSIDSQEDLYRNDWLKRYLAQLTIYLLLASKENGFLILKCIGKRPKFISVSLDYEFAEELLKKAEKINEHVANRTYPEKTEGGHCRFCGFESLCMPQIATQIEFPDLVFYEKLKRWAELRDAAKEFEKLDKEIKESVKGKNVVIGEFTIESKQYLTTVYEVPEEVKNQYKKVVERTRVEIKKFE